MLVRTKLPIKHEEITHRNESLQCIYSCLHFRLFLSSSLFVSSLSFLSGTLILWRALRSLSVLFLSLFPLLLSIYRTTESVEICHCRNTLGALSPGKHDQSANLTICKKQNKGVRRRPNVILTFQKHNIHCYPQTVIRNTAKL